MDASGGPRGPWDPQAGGREPSQSLRFSDPRSIESQQHSSLEAANQERFSRQQRHNKSHGRRWGFIMAAVATFAAVTFMISACRQALLKVRQKVTEGRKLAGDETLPDESGWPLCFVSASGEAQVRMIPATPLEVQQIGRLLRRIRRGQRGPVSTSSTSVSLQAQPRPQLQPRSRPQSPTRAPFKKRKVVLQAAGSSRAMNESADASTSADFSAVATAPNISSGDRSSSAKEQVTSPRQRPAEAPSGGERIQFVYEPITPPDGDSGASRFEFIYGPISPPDGEPGSSSSDASVVVIEDGEKPSTSSAGPGYNPQRRASKLVRGLDIPMVQASTEKTLTKEALDVIAKEQGGDSSSSSEIASASNNNVESDDVGLSTRASKQTADQSEEAEGSARKGGERITRSTGKRRAMESPEAGLSVTQAQLLSLIKGPWRGGSEKAVLDGLTKDVGAQIIANSSNIADHKNPSGQLQALARIYFDLLLLVNALQALGEKRSAVWWNRFTSVLSTGIPIPQASRSWGRDKGVLFEQLCKELVDALGVLCRGKHPDLNKRQRLSHMMFNSRFSPQVLKGYEVLKDL